MSDEPKQDGKPVEKKPGEKKPANAAPDAVMDPNEKTDGHPDMGPQGGRKTGEDSDPGGG